MKRLLVLAVVLLAAAFSTAPLRADVLSFDPLNQSVPLGTQASVNITFDTPIVGDFDMIVNWNPAIVSLFSASFGTALGDTNNPLEVAFSGFDPLPGSEGAFEVSLLSIAELAALQGNGPITLFTLTFDTIGLGTTPLTFSPPQGAGGEIRIGDGEGLQRLFSAETGSITVTGDTAPIPEPATLLLLSTGLGAMLTRLRRRS